MSTPIERERFSLCVVGHVDHGKSTLIGRLLADTHNLPEGKLEEVRARCEQNAKPMEYAFLLDALKDEQAQGITIDSARCFFKTDLRDYIIIDAPGHIEFLKNMVSGAARAEAAFLVIDALEGVQENSRRHGYLLSMLGVKNFAVCVNKMDLVDYDEKVFESIIKEYTEFLAQIDMKPQVFIPVNSREGENIASKSERMSWYSGPTVLSMLDGFEKEPLRSELPLRFPVQDVYKFTSKGDDRRIIAGRVESGVLRQGDDIVFWPSNKRTTLKSIEVFSAPAIEEVVAGESVGITMTEQIYTRRGEWISREGERPPLVSSRIRTHVFWLGRQPLKRGVKYKLKLATTEVSVELEKIHRILDASQLDVQQEGEVVQRHEVADCTLRTSKPIAFDLSSDISATSRFVLVDNYEISGGGIITENLSDDEAALRDEAYHRDRKWVKSSITAARRSERFVQRPGLILITGSQGAGRKALARTLEERLFESGRFVYYLGMGSVVYGLDADLLAGADGSDEGSEHIRRLGETLHLLLETGLIVVCTVLDLESGEVKQIQTLVGHENVVTVSIATETTEPRLDAQLTFGAGVDPLTASSQIIDYLKSERFIPDF